MNLSENRMAHRTGGITVDNIQDPFGQWAWFESVLKKARREDKAVRSTHIRVYQLFKLCYRVRVGFGRPHERAINLN